MYVFDVYHMQFSMHLCNLLHGCRNGRNLIYWFLNFPACLAAQFRSSNWNVEFASASLTCTQRSDAASASSVMWCFSGSASVSRSKHEYVYYDERSLACALVLGFRFAAFKLISGFWVDLICLDQRLSACVCAPCWALDQHLQMMFVILSAVYVSTWMPT